MSLPTQYDSATLVAYLQTVLGPTAEALGWTDGGPLVEAVNDVLIAYGASSLEDATDIGKLRAIARWQAWVWAADALASRYNISTDGQSLSRSQLHEQAVKQRDAAYSAAMPYLSTFAITATPIVHLDDPVDGPIRHSALRGW